MPSDNLRYYRRRNNLTTRQLAEQIGVVPATIVMYENGKHPIPYDVAIKLADVLKIEVSLLYDEFSRFLAAPYTEALKSVRTALGLSQKAFAEQIGLVPSYYYKLEEGSRRPSRKVYQQMNLLFQRRHLIEHNNGMVDQKYIDKSGDNSYAVGQRLVVKGSDPLTLLAIIKKLGKGLVSLKEVPEN